MIQRDYIMRQINLLTQMIIRVLKLKEQKKYDVALKEIGDVFDELFAAEANLLRIVDSATAARILGHWEKVKIFAKICKEEAEIYALKEENVTALAKYKQASELLREAIKMKNSPDEECDNELGKINDKIEEMKNI